MLVVAQAIAVALVEDDARIPGEPTTWNVELMDLSEALVQYLFVPVACHRDDLRSFSYCLHPVRVLLLKDNHCKSDAVGRG